MDAIEWRLRRFSFTPSRWYFSRFTSTPPPFSMTGPGGNARQVRGLIVYQIQVLRTSDATQFLNKMNQSCFAQCKPYISQFIHLTFHFVLAFQL